MLSIVIAVSLHHNPNLIAHHSRPFSYSSVTPRAPPSYAVFLVLATVMVLTHGMVLTQVLVLDRVSLDRTSGIASIWKTPTPQIHCYV